MAGHEHFNLRESHTGESTVGIKMPGFLIQTLLDHQCNGGTGNSPSRKNSHLGQIGPFHVWWTEQNRDSSQIFPRRVCQRSLATLSTRLDWLDGWCLEDYKYTNTKYTNTHIQNTQIQTYKIHKYTHTKTQSLCQRSGHSVDMVGLLGWVVFGGFLLLFGKQQFPVGNLTPLSITFQKLTDSRSLAKHWFFCNTKRAR